MKKTLSKLCALLLVCCSVFSCMIFTASAEETTEVLQSKWDFGAAADMNDKLQLTDSVNGDNDTARYIYWQKYTDYEYSGNAGAYAMTYGETGAGPEGYIVGEVGKTDGTKETVMTAWVRYRGGTVSDPHGPYFNRQPNQNFFSDGIGFTANQAGTIRFTLENYFKGDAKVVVGKASQLSYSGSNNYSNTLYTQMPKLTTYETWTIDVDVKKGEEVVFLVEYIGTTANKDCMLHLKSAEYICGDLTANPITYVLSQETAVYEDTNGEIRFDVRLASAVCKEKAEGKELGYYVTVKYGDKVKVDNLKCPITTAYKTLTAYGEDGNQIDCLNSLQGTYWAAGLIKGIDASQNVTITFKPYADEYMGAEVTISYLNGKFQSNS